MLGGLAVAKYASESNYHFKNVLMVSPYYGMAEEKSWDGTENLIIKYTKEAKKRDENIKFYATYSYNENNWAIPGDVNKTIKFVKETLHPYLDLKEWHLPAVYSHDTAVWDVATYDGDGDGKADIWNELFGE